MGNARQWLLLREAVGRRGEAGRTTRVISRANGTFCWPSASYGHSVSGPSTASSIICHDGAEGALRSAGELGRGTAGEQLVGRERPRSVAGYPAGRLG